nr:IS3 family transposase [Pseudomonas aeruginosa]HEE6759657.1 IS3 family transposase [Pseudomonas aeruginosa]
MPIHSRPGNCRDNAATESYFRSLKAERVYLTRYASYQEAKTDLFDYIRFYNHRAVATRRWAISVRWKLSGSMRAVALNYLSTSSGTDQFLAYRSPL